MALFVNVNGGVVLLAAVPYDDLVVSCIRELPERRYRGHSKDWCVPARRQNLRYVWTMIAELEERRINVEVSMAAQARLDHVDVGRAVLRDRVIEITGPFSERRLPALRDLPERRFDPDRKVWTIALTRAGALSILTLVNDTDELVVTRRTRRALERCAAEAEPAPHGTTQPDRPLGPPRRSPIAHWRHYTTGPVFDNPARERIHVPGIGICVRVRVRSGSCACDRR